MMWTVPKHRTWLTAFAVGFAAGFVAASVDGAAIAVLCRVASRSRWRDRAAPSAASPVGAEPVDAVR